MQNLIKITDFVNQENQNHKNKQETQIAYQEYKRQKI